MTYNLIVCAFGGISDGIPSASIDVNAGTELVGAVCVKLQAAL